MIRNCFIIMGFHIKTMEDGKQYNLDLSYEKIIKPVLERLDIEYIRADEIMRSEIIDESMYRLLLCADLVIADITTLNPNALYELGVRYALKSYSTILIGDKNTNLPFGLNHLRVFSYEHSGMSIAAQECIRLQDALFDTIQNMRNSELVDSPVYKYIRGLIPPVFPSNASYFRDITTRFRADDSLCALVNTAYQKRDRGDFTGGVESYKKALAISKDEYIIKEIAVCTYQGGTREDYMEALQFLKKESNANTTNPEILKAFGTIYKHLWMEDKVEQLAELALNYYQKSYVLYPSHNSGLNYGLMLFALASYQTEKVMCDTYVFWARHIYRQTEQLCLHLNPIEDYWIAASLEECAVALEDHEKVERYRRASEMAMALLDSSMKWKREKTEEQISLLQELLLQIKGRHFQASRRPGGGVVS